MMDVFSPEKVAHAIAGVRSMSRKGMMRGIVERKRQLNNLRRFIVECEEDFIQALQSDLHKCRLEAALLELDVSRNEIDHALTNLDNWMKPKSVSTPLIAFPASSSVRPQPKGVVLLISPFNYPAQLALIPLVAALSAGNTVVLKPSELAPATSSVFANLLNKYVPPNIVAVLEGGVEISQYLLSQRFDHIFFTGSPRVGKIVLKAAADYLTPVTLELGGKCPAIVLQSADIEISAKRIMWSKWVNAGQTCIAADYAMVHSSLLESFVEACGQAVKQFADNASPRESSQFCHIVTIDHTRRIQSLLQQSVAAGAIVRSGGEVVVKERYVAPTVLTNVLPSNPLMQDELFAPLLPVIAIESMDDAIDFINDREKPLALYVFSSKTSDVEYILGQTSSGGVCINDITYHKCGPDLPLRGVGNSGFGGYGGKTGFDELSHMRSVMQRSFWLDIPQRYPPYTPGTERFLRFAASLTRINSVTLKRFVIFLLAFTASAGLLSAYSRL